MVDNNLQIIVKGLNATTRSSDDIAIYKATCEYDKRSSLMESTLLNYDIVNDVKQTIDFLLYEMKSYSVLIELNHSKQYVLTEMFIDDKEQLFDFISGNRIRDTYTWMLATLISNEK